MGKSFNIFVPQFHLLHRDINRRTHKVVVEDLMRQSGKPCTPSATHRPAVASPWNWLEMQNVRTHTTLTKLASALQQGPKVNPVPVQSEKRLQRGWLMVCSP